MNVEYALELCVAKCEHVVRKNWKILKKKFLLATREGAEI
jgi:hypothetical protein